MKISPSRTENYSCAQFERRRRNMMRLREREREVASSCSASCLGRATRLAFALILMMDALVSFLAALSLGAKSCAGGSLLLRRAQRRKRVPPPQAKGAQSRDEQSPRDQRLTRYLFAQIALSSK